MLGNASASDALLGRFSERRGRAARRVRRGAEEQGWCAQWESCALDWVEEVLTERGRRRGSGSVPSLKPGLAGKVFLWSARRCGMFTFGGWWEMGAGAQRSKLRRWHSAVLMEGRS